jgi:hypothetical protein
MAIQTSAGTTLSASASLPATYDAAGYGALSWSPVGEITEIPAFGSVYNLITHMPLGERRVVKRKGSVNDGSLTLNFAADVADTGQGVLKTAHTADTEISIKITYPDGEDDYFTGLVMGYQINPGNVDSIKSDSVTLELTTAPVNVAA